MKILFCGYHNPHFMSFCEYIERAIAGLGHTLKSCDYRNWLIPGRIRDRLPVLQGWDMRRINQDFIKAAREFQPEVVLVTGGWTISKETVMKIKEETKAVMVNWIADFPLKFDTYLAVGPAYDYFFTSGTEALNRYKAAGHQNGHWLPFACDEEIHQPVALTEEEKNELSSDICFVGSNYKERVEILEQLTDFDLGVWGPGWDRLPKGSPLSKCIRGASVRPQMYRKIFHVSKIALNIIGHRCDVMEPYIEAEEFRMTNTKVFEILGTEAFELVDAKADAKSLFQDGKHLCFYEDAPGLKGLIQHYLNSGEERKKIARQGREEVLKKHTYKHRIEEMLSIAR